MSSKKIKTATKQLWAILATSKGQSQNNIPSMVLFLTLHPLPPPQCLSLALNSNLTFHGSVPDSVPRSAWAWHSNLTFHSSVPDSVPSTVSWARAELRPFRELADLDLTRDVTLLRRLRHQTELVDTELLWHCVFPVHASHNCKQQKHLMDVFEFEFEFKFGLVDLPIPKDLAPTYYSAKISRKLNQNDENWTGGGSKILLCIYRSFTDLLDLLTSGSVPAATLLIAVREDASAPGWHVPAVGHALRQVSAHSGLPQLRTHPPSRLRLIQDEPPPLLIRTESSLPLKYGIKKYFLENTNLKIFVQSWSKFPNNWRL